MRESPHNSVARNVGARREHSGVSGWVSVRTLLHVATIRVYIYVQIVLSVCARLGSVRQLSIDIDGEPMLGMLHLAR